MLRINFGPRKASSERLCNALYGTQGKRVPDLILDSGSMCVEHVLQVFCFPQQSKKVHVGMMETLMTASVKLLISWCQEFSQPKVLL